VTFFDEKLRSKQRLNSKSPILSTIKEVSLATNPSSIIKLPKIIKVSRTPQKIRFNSNEKLKIIQFPEEKFKIQRQSSEDELKLYSLKNFYIDNRKDLNRADSSLIIHQGYSSPAMRSETNGNRYGKLSRRYSNPRKCRNILENSSHSFIVTNYK
jgi:hypothetical protein